MSAYPLIEALLLPAFVVLTAYGYPALARALCTRLAPDEFGRAWVYRGALVGGASLVGWLSHGALGPALIERRGWASVFFAGGALLLFAARAVKLAPRRSASPPSQPSPRGPADSSEDTSSPSDGLSQSAPGASSIEQSPEPPLEPTNDEPLQRFARLALGLALGVSVALSVVGVRRVVSVPPGAAATTTMTQARWALRLDPWDGEAYLAAGWDVRAEDRARARGMLALAARAGADPTDHAVLEAELAALDGDCDAARAAFERALLAHTEAAFASGARLELGGVPVPDGLALHCDLRQ